MTPRDPVSRLDWHLQIDVRRRIATPSRKLTGGTTIERSPCAKPIGCDLDLPISAQSSFTLRPEQNSRRPHSLLDRGPLKACRQSKPDLFPSWGRTGIVGLSTVFAWVSERRRHSRNQVGAGYLLLIVRVAATRPKDDTGTFVQIFQPR